MNRIVIVKLILLIFCVLVFAEEVKTSGTPTYESFSNILENNIFNPNRRNFQSSDYSGESNFDSDARDSISLVGVWIDNQSIAFFEGSRSEFNKTAEINENIAGFTVKEIKTDYIILKSEEEEIKLEVGWNINKDNSGKWQTSSGTANYTGTYGRRNKTDDNFENKNETSGNSSSGDLLKQLMERRKQELKK